MKIRMKKLYYVVCRALRDYNEVEAIFDTGSSAQEYIDKTIYRSNMLYTFVVPMPYSMEVNENV